MFGLRSDSHAWHFPIDEVTPSEAGDSLDADESQTILAPEWM
jgi:hypothetical protein